MIRTIIFSIIFCVLFTSCFEKDEMVIPPEPGEIKTMTIPMTQYYSNQVYFSFAEDTITAINDRSLYDLNFDCNDTSTIIRLNTASFAMAAETNYEELKQVTDTLGLKWFFDGSTGDTDSLAIHNWIAINDDDTTYSNKVWVINRGVSSLGVNLGLIKVKFNKLKDNKYYFTYSQMDNSGLVDAIVEKHDLYNYTQYSFMTSENLQPEPEKAKWDLLFTQYTSLLYTNEGDPYPYLVTGALQNYTTTKVAMDSTLIFNEITLNDTSFIDFSTQFDKVGYDWKELVGDVNTGNVSYVVRYNYNYIIRSGNGYYYKLRFVNFYDPDTGEKGFPSFEYQQL